ncbi:MAG: S53 family peptidase [Candidatus Marsarchaeota archaeon]|nr:S53 family peptidase [Candidatus Marsarchaeota archaeon]
MAGLRLFAAAVSLAALLFLSLGSAGVSAAGSSNLVYLANPPRVFYSASQGSSSGNNICSAGSGGGSTFKLHCYTPQVLQAAYNFTGAYKLVGGEANAGSGETIVIIDAYGSPTIRHDVAVFDTKFNLPPINLNIYCPQGCPSFNPESSNEVGWSFETTLDVEYSHAMAPGATIDLVIASTNFGNAINNAEQFALKNRLGEIWSMSFGAPECAFKGDNSQFLQSQLILEAATAEGVTPIASAGDSGAQEGCPSPSALYPSSNPLVLAVGGTHLNVGNGGAYVNESAWNDEEDQFLLSQGVTFPYATGGAPSVFFAAPTYQEGVTITPYNCASETASSCVAGQPYSPSTRVTSDVSYDADLDGGVLLYWSAIPSQAGYYIVGGTSAGSPQWSAVLAIAYQYAGAAAPGSINPYLYKLAGTPAFHDVSQGSNTLMPGEGFLSTLGYDPPTGLGSPNVGILVTRLAQLLPTA